MRRFLKIDFEGWKIFEQTEEKKLEKRREEAKKE